MGLAPIVVEQLYELVAQIAKEGVSILVVEQFARAVLGIVDWVGIMVRGRVTELRDAGRNGSRVVDRIPGRMRDAT